MFYTIYEWRKLYDKIIKELFLPLQSDMDAVYFKQGQDLTSVELKVPVEDTGPEEPTQA